jgi:hypothetical protein
MPVAILSIRESRHTANCELDYRVQRPLWPYAFPFRKKWDHLCILYVSGGGSTSEVILRDRAEDGGWHTALCLTGWLLGC